METPNEEDIFRLKSELGIVDALGIYNFQTRNYLFKDANLQATDFIESVDESVCFENCETMYLDIEDKKFFAQCREKHLIFIQFKAQRDINKILVEHEIKKAFQALD